MLITHIYGSTIDTVPSCTHTLEDGQSVQVLLSYSNYFKVGSLKFTALLTPCHTKGHLLFELEGQDSEPNVLFTGDTLFVGGCGKFFEGTAQDMYSNITRISKLPHTTQLFCGHGKD